MTSITGNAISEILAEIPLKDPVLQVTSIQPMKQQRSTIVTYRLHLSDGIHTHPCLIPQQLNNFVEDNILQGGSIISLTDYKCKQFLNFTYVFL